MPYGKIARRGLIALAIIFIAESAIAESEPPTPSAPAQSETPNHNTKNNNQCPNSDQRGTESSPFIVKILPPSIHDEAPTYNTNYHYQEAAESWWMIIPTWLLALFTGLLFWYTFKLWRSTSKLVRDTENSSERQLRAYVGAAYYGIKIDETSGGQRRLVAYINYANQGQTPALKVKVRLDAKVFDSDIIPNWERPKVADDERKGGDMLPTVMWTRHCLIGGIDENTINAIADGTKKAWVWGTITYKDIFGKYGRVKFRFSSAVKIREKDAEHRDWRWFALIPDIAHSKARYGIKKK